MTRDAVTARFGGRDLTFKIARSALPAFEARMNRTARAVALELMGGDPKIATVRDVLNFAAPKGLGKHLPMSDYEIQMASVYRALDRSLAEIHFRSNGEPHRTFVEQVLADNPPAQYAPLAAAVLAAALFGISEDEATFTDEGTQ